MSKPGYYRCGCIEPLLNVACQLQLKLLFLLFPEFGNVLGDGDEMGQMAGLIPHGRDGLLSAEEFAGLLAVDDHPLAGGSVGELGPHLPIKFLVVQARPENSRGLAQRFLFVVAGRRHECGIHVLNDALGIGQHDAVGSLLDHPGKQYETLEGLASLGEIMERHHSSGDYSGRAFEGPCVHANPDSGTVLSPAHKNKLIDDFFSANGEGKRQLNWGHD
jgi:hypothetical protein